MHGRDEVTIILRGTTLLDVRITSTHLRRINAYLCNGSARPSLLEAVLLWVGCSGRSYFSYMGTAFHQTAALCESIVRALIPFIAF